MSVSRLWVSAFFVLGLFAYGPEQAALYGMSLVTAVFALLGLGMPAEEGER